MSSFSEDPKLPSMRVSLTYTSCIYSIFVFEWLSSLRKEYNLVWRAKPSLVSALYFALRYWPLPKFAISIYLNSTIMDLESCTKWCHFQVFANLPITLALSLLLTLRLYAVYERNHYLLGGLLACIAAMTVVIIFGSFNFAAPTFISGSGPCFAEAKPDSSNIKIALWLGPFIFDCLTTTLLIARILLVQRRGASRIGIVHTLMRDGALYFAVISAVNLINVGFLLGAPASFANVNAGMSYMVSAMAGCRLVLSLRGSAEKASSLNTADITASFGARKTPREIGLTTFSQRVPQTATTGVARINTNAMHLAFNPRDFSSKEQDNYSEDERALPGVHIITERHTAVDADSRLHEKV